MYRVYNRVNLSSLKPNLDYINEQIMCLFYGIHIREIALDVDAKHAGYAVKVICTVEPDDTWKLHFVAPFFRIEKARGHHYLEDSLMLILFGALTREIELRKSSNAGLLRNSKKSTSSSKQSVSI